MDVSNDLTNAPTPIPIAKPPLPPKPKPKPRPPQDKVRWILILSLGLGVVGNFLLQSTPLGIANLSADATPMLLKLKDEWIHMNPPPMFRSQSKTMKTNDWRTWNWSRARAEKLLSIEY